MGLSRQPATLSGMILEGFSKAVPTPSPAVSLPVIETIRTDVARGSPQISADEGLAEVHLRGGDLKKRPSTEKISHLVWFLAGGIGKPPTGRELKDWKKKDQAALVKKTGKQQVGFWGEFERGLSGKNKEEKKRKDASADASGTGA